MFTTHHVVLRVGTTIAVLVVLLASLDCPHKDRCTKFPSIPLPCSLCSFFIYTARIRWHAVCVPEIWHVRLHEPPPYIQPGTCIFICILVCMYTAVGSSTRLAHTFLLSLWHFPFTFFFSFLGPPDRTLPCLFVLVLHCFRADSGARGSSGVAISRRITASQRMVRLGRKVKVFAEGSPYGMTYYIISYTPYIYDRHSFS